MQLYIRRHGVPVKPNGIEAYFDRIQFWLKHPASAAELSKLRRQCGHLHEEKHSARFGQGYKQRVEIKQPSAAALRWVAAREDALINLVEVALDLIFETSAERDQAKEFANQHWVRRHHGRTQKVRCVPGWKETTYDARRWAPNSRVSYKENHCRVTGELNCLHLEWRVCGVEAVRRVGIESPADLLDFDHREFWRRRLIFYGVDIEKLGRRLRNYRTKGRCRTSDVRDNRAGRVLLNGSGSVQELIDKWGSRLGLSRVLVLIDNQGWLPGSP